MNTRMQFALLGTIVLIIGPAQRSTTVAAQTCDEAPPDSYKRSIQATVDGDPLTVTVSARFGGAIESLTWRGQEFINIWDHGRQISYAWQMDGYGECFNPTEPGSSRDYQSAGSTSRLLQVCSGGENSLTTTTQPAFWLAPGESGYCSGGSMTAVNESVLSDQLLEKTIEIGYRGIDNVVAFTAVVTLAESYGTMQLEIPTGYLTHEFDSYWEFNPQSGVLSQPASDPLTAPWSFQHIGTLPTILATSDGAYAMGAYTAEPILFYGTYGTNASNPHDRTNKWHMVLREQPASAGAYTYRSFVVVGSLDSVQAAMRELYELHPVDFVPPTGFIDVLTCNQIAGWAWDPKVPDQPIDVAFYAVEADGTETLLGRVTASNLREDLVAALGDNGHHGYSFPASQILHDGNRRVLRAYAINSNPDLPPQLLHGSGGALTCPELGPTAATDPDPTTQPSVSTTAEPEGVPPGTPCTAGMVPLILMLVLWMDGSKRSVRSGAWWARVFAPPRKRP